jgi:hypothetical protein
VKRKPKTKEQKEKDRIRSKKRYLENKHNPEFMERIKRNTRNWQLRFPEKYLLSSCRVRAKRKGIPFNLKLSDIKIPDVCPILGIQLKVGTGNAHANSPTLDRIVPELGYVRGNVWVISLRANLMKSNASKEELRLFAKWVLTL